MMPPVLAPKISAASIADARIQIYILRVADRYAQVKVCIARLHTHHMAHAYKYSDRLCDVQ